MTQKQWIWITIAIAVFHGIISFLITQNSFGVIMSRFDGNPYQSPWEMVLIGLFFLINLPYLILTYFTLGYGPGKHIVSLVLNSLVYGLLGAWLISLFPFMKRQSDSPE